MSNVQIDDTQVRNLFDALDDETNKKVLNTALRKGANKLSNLTKLQLRARLGAGASTPNRWNGKTMESGIRLRADKDYCEVSVNIMGDFRLKFFEKGTQLRTTRKSGANRGRIRGLNFFSDARNREGEIIETINKSIDNSLKRIR